MLDNAYAAICTTNPRAFSVNGHAGPGEIVLVFSGEADVTAAPLLAHALSRASSYGNTRISVDLADLEFIDTHCLAIIFGAHDELRDRGGDLVLRSPRPQVRRLLDILQRQDLIEGPRAR
jgi:anti-sigma B factor antagonist